jgi:phenylalanine-4-hydroxylase
MYHMLNQLVKITRDLIVIPSAEEMLTGHRMLRPFLKHQNTWIRYFHPDVLIEDGQDTWALLQQFVMPLIKLCGSSYHLQGIQQLGLDAPQMPEFVKFKSAFRSISRGFDLVSVDGEIDAKTYFEFIRNRQFPCVNRLRPIEEVFCGNAPDFWHEAIGHIAPLCCQEVQEFYLRIADYMLSAKSQSEFNAHLAVSWTLTEYAFISENGENRMFGAALIGSHLAHMRYLRGLLSIEPAVRSNIIDSGFYQENLPAPRDEQGRLRFFKLDHLNVDTLFTHNS